jgi:hypothetical protein
MNEKVVKMPATIEAEWGAGCPHIMTGSRARTPKRRGGGKTHARVGTCEKPDPALRRKATWAYSMDQARNILKEDIVI